MTTTTRNDTRTLIDLEQQIPKTLAEPVDETDDEAVTSRFKRADALYFAIAEAPCRTTADAVAKLRGLLDPDLGIDLEEQDETSLAGVLDFLKAQAVEIGLTLPPCARPRTRGDEDREEAEHADQ
jgi:hypothetical protein